MRITKLYKFFSNFLFAVQYFDIGYSRKLVVMFSYFLLRKKQVLAARKRQKLSRLNNCGATMKQYQMSMSYNGTTRAGRYFYEQAFSLVKRDEECNEAYTLFIDI